MNVFLWVLQILLAAAFAVAGSTKVLQPYDKLRANPQMAWVGDFSPGTVKAIGSLELLAAPGLILPAASGMADPHRQHRASGPDDAGRRHPPAPS